MIQLISVHVLFNIVYYTLQIKAVIDLLTGQRVFHPYLRHQKIGNITLKIISVTFLYPTQRVAEDIMFLTRPSVCQSVSPSVLFYF